ncbi:MAG: hypothetical protein Kow00109_23560 [Acidobacteriota bacterium]
MIGWQRIRQRSRIEEDSSADGYWASYSDLMAGLLLVFAVAAATSWMEFQQRMIEPTEPLREWQRFLDSICQDEFFRSDPRIQVDCETGTLIITEASLSYEKSAVDLPEAGKQILVEVVPKYLEKVTQYLTGRVQIDGIEIAGHTDSTGDYGSNSYISRERAGRVLLFLVDAPELAPFRQILLTKGYATGYADSRPPRSSAPAAPGLDWPEARRIEVQVHIDKTSILRDIKRLLDTLVNR